MGTGSGHGGLGSSGAVGGGGGGGGGGSGVGGGGGGADEVREQDRFLPIANISRILKRALPPSARVSKEAKEAVQEGVSEFISFVTSEASDRCQQEKRKTINGDDLLWAMGTLGFERYVEPLRLYLAKYRDATARVSSAGAKGRGRPPGSGAGGGGGGAAGAAAAAGTAASFPVDDVDDGGLDEDG